MEGMFCRTDDDIDGVSSDGPCLHDDLAVERLGVLHFIQLHWMLKAESVDADRLHHFLPNATSSFVYTSRKPCTSRKSSSLRFSN